jgi:hypothetical protein
MRMRLLFPIVLLLLIVVAPSCRKDVAVFINEDTSVDADRKTAFPAFTC